MLIQHTYLGNYPKERQDDWTSECQGLSHDANHWFITQKGAVWRVPLEKDFPGSAGFTACGAPGVGCEPPHLGERCVSELRACAVVSVGGYRSGGCAALLGGGLGECGLREARSARRDKTQRPAGSGIPRGGAPIRGKAGPRSIQGPLMDAAWQLGNRIDNIRHRGFLGYLAEGSGREQDAKLTTLFRFAQYFGWREFVRGEVQLLRFENEKDTQLVSGFLNDVAWIFSSDSLDGARAMLWADEQRGIGELMASDRRGSSGVRGHAAFHRDYEEVFAPWMERLAGDVLSPAAVGSDRLRLLQWALFGLVRRLDEEGTYGPSEWTAHAEVEIRNAASPRSVGKQEAKLREHLDELLDGRGSARPIAVSS